MNPQQEIEVDSLVNVYAEWDPLEEIIVGTMAGARIPSPGPDLFAVEYVDHGSPDNIPSGPFAQQIVDETEEELALLRDQLAGMGVKVRRPQARDLSAKIATPDWETDGFYDYCPRDGFVIVGNTIIETPMVLRSRFLESLAYKELFLEYFSS